MLKRASTPAEILTWALQISNEIVNHGDFLCGSHGLVKSLSCRSLWILLHDIVGSLYLTYLNALLEFA